MSKGGRILCIALAVLLAASLAFALHERSRADSLGAQLLNEQAAAKEEIAELVPDVGSPDAHTPHLAIGFQQFAALLGHLVEGA